MKGEDMEMDAEVLRQRTKQFALRIIRMTQQLPRSRETDVIARQLLRSATSTAANYRAACRARSHADFYAKLCIVLEEADESLFWLELLGDSGIVAAGKLRDLMKEGNELVAIFAASRSTARSKQSATQKISNSQN
jgi:four helix bundle protein